MLLNCLNPHTCRILLPKTKHGGCRDKDHLGEASLIIFGERKPLPDTRLGALSTLGDGVSS